MTKIQDLKEAWEWAVSQGSPQGNLRESSPDRGTAGAGAWRGTCPLALHLQASTACPGSLPCAPTLSLPGFTTSLSLIGPNAMTRKRQILSLFGVFIVLNSVTFTACLSWLLQWHLCFSYSNSSSFSFFLFFPLRCYPWPSPLPHSLLKYGLSSLWFWPWLKIYFLTPGRLNTRFISMWISCRPFELEVSKCNLYSPKFWSVSCVFCCDCSPHFTI